MALLSITLDSKEAEQRRLFVAAGMAMALIGLDSTGAGGPREARALSNADVAHACNQGGYQHYLRGSDLTPFKNAGDCVSYATRTGNVLVPACTPSTADAIGCLTFSNLTLPDTSSSITLNGVITFTTCLTLGEGTRATRSRRPVSAGTAYRDQLRRLAPSRRRASTVSSNSVPSRRTWFPATTRWRARLNFFLTLTPNGWGLYVRDVVGDSSHTGYELFSIDTPTGFFLNPAPLGLITC